MGLRMQVFGHLLLHLLFSSYFDAFRCEAGQPQGGEVVQLLMDGVPWHALLHRYNFNISGLVLFRCRRERLPKGNVLLSEVPASEYNTDGVPQNSGGMFRSSSGETDR